MSDHRNVTGMSAGAADVGAVLLRVESTGGPKQTARADEFVVGPEKAREIATTIFRLLDGPVALTPTQWETLETFDRLRVGCVSPTTREMADAIGISVAAMHERTCALVRRGYMTTSPTKRARALALSETGAAALAFRTTSKENGHARSRRPGPDANQRR